MLSTKLKSITFAVAILLAAAVLFVYPVLKSESAAPAIDDLQKEMEQVKAEMERGSTQARLRYGLLANALSKCNTVSQTTEPTIRAPFSPAASLCINGALAVADPDFNRPLAASTGTGVGTGVVGNCSLSGTATAANYDAYGFNLSGCSVFPTEITATLCGPVGCQHVGNLDTMIVLYRNVAAGDPLTANGGLPAVFNPASPCTNARAGQDDLGTVAGTANNPGGSTCNQVVGANCVAPCTSPSNAGALSGFRRNLGNGRFTIVVTGFANATVGTYNLYVNAPAAGCAIALAPTSGSGNISGRVTTSTGQGISKATLTITGSEIAPMTVRTSAFGYYNFPNLPVGATYIVSISSKTNTFANPSQTVNLDDSAADINFVSEQ